MNNFKVMMNGIIKENPTFVLMLGMCPTLGTRGVATTLEKAGCEHVKAAAQSGFVFSWKTPKTLRLRLLRWAGDYTRMCG